MSLRTISVIACLLVLATSAPRVAAQFVIQGSVVAADTGEPLPAATVQVVGDVVGAVTNAEGRFRLAGPRPPYRLVARFIGYRSAEIFVESSNAGPVRFELDPEPVTLAEVIVSGEDPGVEIMRRAIAAKLAWRDSVSSSYSEVYTRFLLYADNRPVRLEETIGASWWKAGEGAREVVRARRTRPVRAERFLYAQPLAVPTMYGDEIVLDGTRFVGPLHPDALDWYRFRLIATRQRDGRPVYDVAFSPRANSAAVFVGGLAVEGSTFDVLEITARPTVDRTGPPPVQERSLRIAQQFIRKNGAMLPVGFQAEGSVRFGRAGVAYPTARYRQVSGFALHATRVPLPDTLFQSSRVSRVDPGAERQDWLFGFNPGLVPPTEQDLLDIARIDPTRVLAMSFRPVGLLSQYAAVPITESANVDPATESEPGIELLKPWIWYNRVDGWQVGVRPVVRPTRSLTLRPGVGYAEASKMVPWTVSLVWKPDRRIDAELGAERFTGISGLGLDPDRFLKGMAAYAGYNDYYDYYDRARRWASMGIRLGPLRVQLMGAHERHRSSLRNDDYRGWLMENDQRDNPPIEAGQLALGELRFTMGNPKLDNPRYDWHADLRLEAAAKDVLGSDFGYKRWQIGGGFRVPTLLRRRAQPASLRVDVVAGEGSDSVPVQRRGVLEVAAGPVATDVGFRSSRDSRVFADEWVAVFWEHDFSSAISERIGLGETRLGFLIFGAHGSAWHGETFRRDEIGIAWSKPWNLPFRINVATELNGYHPVVTVQYYGVARRLLRR